jgi:hypothetical protein
MTSRSAVLYLTHVWSPVHALRYRRLRQQTVGIADCYLLFHGSNDDVRAGPENAASGALHVFQASELPRRLGYRYLTPHGLVPGCPHFAVIDFSKRRSYRHYWLIEGDVEFSGDWATLLQAGTTTEAGLLASHVRRYRDAPDWCWWNSLSIPFPADAVIPNRIGNRRKAFMPVYRISFDALQLIDRLHRIGCVGHFEALLPTAIFNAGLGLVDLMDLNSAYRGTEQDPVSDIARQSTVRYQPEVSLSEFIQRFATNTIFHPVKGEWTFDGTNVILARADGHTTLRLDAHDSRHA